MLCRLWPNVPQLAVQDRLDVMVDRDGLLVSFYGRIGRDSDKAPRAIDVRPPQLPRLTRPHRGIHADK